MPRVDEIARDPAGVIAERLARPCRPSVDGPQDATVEVSPSRVRHRRSSASRTRRRAPPARDVRPGRATVGGRQHDAVAASEPVLCVGKATDHRSASLPVGLTVHVRPPSVLCIARPASPTVQRSASPAKATSAMPAYPPAGCGICHYQPWVRSARGRRRGQRAAHQRKHRDDGGKEEVSSAHNDPPGRRGVRRQRRPSRARGAISAPPRGWRRPWSASCRPRRSPR